MRIERGIATDIGRVRERNEDSFLVEPPVFAVADGMGGHRGGEVASHLALETVETLAREGAGSLADQVRQANRAVFAQSQRDKAVTGMGTTLTAARLEGTSAQLAHVGDSRAYLIRAGVMRRLTDDHTLVNRMVKAGEISEEEAEVHPHRNVLTRSLGTEPEIDVDTDEVPLLDGDRILLCSDGLFAMVREEQIQAICETEPDPQKAADKLVRAANRAGGVDNITVLVLDVHDDGEPGDAAERTAASEPDRRRGRLARWIVGAVVAVVVLGAAWTFGQRYVDRQWYVGQSGTNVAIYQGVPAQPLGVHLSHVVLVTRLPADKVAALELYRNLSQGISANSRADADAIVQQMQQDLKAAAGGGGG